MMTLKYFIKLLFAEEWGTDSIRYELDNEYKNNCNLSKTTKRINISLFINQKNIEKL